MSHFTMLQAERATYLFQNIFHLKQDCITQWLKIAKKCLNSYLNFRAKIGKMSKTQEDTLR